MAIPSSGEIKMGGAGTNSIAQVKAGTDTGLPSAIQNVSLRGLSVDGVNDFEYVGGAGVDIAVAGSSPDQVAPHAMSEFYGYVNAIQTVNNQTVGTASFAQIVTSSNNFVVGGGSWQLVNKSLTTGVSGELQHFWYIQEASSTLGGSYNGSAMTTGFNYGWHRVTFNSSNIPDSYYIDVTHTLTQVDGVLQAFASEAAGTGETYTSGANWDNTVYTLLPTSNSGGTAFKVVFNANDECDDFSVYWTTNIKIYYKKSGYPDLLAVNRDITTEIDGYWTASTCQ
jgi:hypothetical protein